MRLVYLSEQAVRTLLWRQRRRRTGSCWRRLRSVCLRGRRRTLRHQLSPVCWLNSSQTDSHQMTAAAGREMLIIGCVQKNGIFFNFKTISICGYLSKNTPAVSLLSKHWGARGAAKTCNTRKIHLRLRDSLLTTVADDAR